MASIYSRLEHLRRSMDKNRKITVFYADGTRKNMGGGDCISLVLESGGDVERFEARGGGCGLLPDLLSDLL